VPGEKNCCRSGAPPIKKDDQLNFFQALEKNALLEFPVDPQGGGYDGFIKDRERAIEQVNQRFGTMIGESVRLKFFGFDDELEGKLVLDTLLIPEARGEDVPLRIGRATFDLRDVERCTLLER